MKKRKREDNGDNTGEGEPQKILKSTENSAKNDDKGQTAAEFVKSVKTSLSSPQTVVSGLAKLRDRLRDANKPRSVEVFREFLQRDAALRSIFAVMEKGRNPSTQLQFQLALEVLECSLLLAAEEGASSSTRGMEIVHHILQSHLKTLYSCLNPASPATITKAVLKLLAAMVTQGTVAAREVQGMFDFSLKALAAVANRRDSRSNQDIRTCFIHFCLSFFIFGDVPVMKNILELKGFLGFVVKGLLLDPPDVVLLVLNTLQRRVINNANIPKKTKILFFNAFTLGQLARLYHYTKDHEGADRSEADRPTVRQAVHSFLLTLSSSFKFGICFSNKMGGLATRTNNPVLLRFLQSLPKVVEDPLVQELVMAALKCCPDLLQPYLSNLSLTYEPRLSMPWLMNVNLLIKIYSSLPLPSQMISRSGLKASVHLIPPLVNMIVPPGITRSVFSHGIQHSCHLVKQTTLKLLLVVLERALDLTENCGQETSDSHTPETSFQHSFSDATFKMVPDVKTLISLRQNLVADKKSTCEEEEKKADEHPSVLLLSQALKAILLYQKLWPTVLSQAGFDLGKLLSWQHSMNDSSVPPIVLHLTLQILLQSPPGSIKWHHQKGKASPAVMHRLLTLLASPRHRSVSSAAGQLISKLLRETGLVGRDTEEVRVWLRHLNSGHPDQSSLDRRVGFLHEAFRETAAEPYSYTDTITELVSEVWAKRAGQERGAVGAGSRDYCGRSRLPFSALVVRVLIQYAQLLAADHAEAGALSRDLRLGCIVEYVTRSLVDVLRSQTDPTTFCLAVQRYLGNICIPEECHVTGSTHDALLSHVRWWSDLHAGVACPRPAPTPGSAEHLAAVKDFLEGGRPRQESDLGRLLAPLGHAQWVQVAPMCVDFCASSLGDFSPIVRYLGVRFFKLDDCVAGEDLLRVYRALPFSGLLWQVLGGDLGRVDSHQDPEIRALLLSSLEKEPASARARHCKEVLLFVKKFTRRFLSSDEFDEQKPLKQALALCFQILETLVSKAVQCFSADEQTFHMEMAAPERENKKRAGNEQTVATALLVNLFQDPFLIELFLCDRTAEVEDSKFVVASCELTFHVSNLLWIVLQARLSSELAGLSGPFLHKIYCGTQKEIQQSKEKRWTHFPALFLLGIFHSFCEKQKLNEVLTAILELPSNMLLESDEISKKRQSAPLLDVLCILLEGRAGGNREGRRASTQSFEFHLAESSLEEALPAGSVAKLIALLQGCRNPRLDAAVCSVLSNSPQLALACPLHLLDCCLDDPNDARVAIAATLISRNEAMRSRLESRGLAAKGGLGTKGLERRAKPWDVKQNLAEFVPLVEAYLETVQRKRHDTSGDQRVVDMLSLLYGAYHEPLWQDLLSARCTSPASQDACCRVLRKFIRLRQSDVAELRGYFESLVRLTDAKAWNRHQISIATELCVVLGSRSPSIEPTVRTQLVFACMTSISRVLCGTDCSAGQHTSNNCKAEELLEVISSNAESIPGNLSESLSSVWNKFLKDCLKYNMDSAGTLRALCPPIKSVYASQAHASLLSLGAIWELVTSHSHFLPIMLSDEQSEVKGALVELLLCVAQLDSSCCQAAHLPVLFGAYSSSLTPTDQALLQLLSVYEKSRVSLKQCRPYLWGRAAVDAHQHRRGQAAGLWGEPDPAQLLEQLDPGLLIRSALAFPLKRTLKLDVQRDLAPSPDLPDSHDPCFLLPLFSFLLSPSSVVDCRKFVERGCLGYTVSSLASRDDHVRRAGYHVMSRYLHHLEGARFREKKQIVLLLDCLKNGIPELHARVPSVITCFVLRAAHILLQPDHFLYVLVNSYLLQRPALELREVPLFYTLFNSSSMQHRKERNWMLQLLVSGLRDSPDYYLYKRRHVIELALSYHASQLSDQQTQAQVIQLLAAALSIHAAAFDLAKNYGIVAWIHALCHNTSKPGADGGLGPGLQLFHTLWFTLKRGKPSTGARDTSDSGHEKRDTPLPPTLRQECSLVSWSILELLRTNSNDRSPHNMCLYIELLYSVVAHATDSGECSGLTHERMLQLISLWSETFGESELHNELLAKFRLSSPLSELKPVRASDSTTKKNTAASLLALIELWSRDHAPFGTSVRAAVLDVIRFAWHLGMRLVVTSGLSVPETCAASELRCVETFLKRLETDTHLQKLLADAPC